MAYMITLRAGHPRKQFRRDGRLYVEGEPVVVDELSDALIKELEKPRSWLTCEEIAAQAEATGPQEGNYILDTHINSQEAPADEDSPEGCVDLDTLKMAELRALAAREGLELSGRVRKAELLAALRAKLEVVDAALRAHREEADADE